MAKPLPHLSRFELQCLRLLWDEEEATVRDIHDKIGDRDHLAVDVDGAAQRRPRIRESGGGIDIQVILVEDEGAIHHHIQ